MHARTISLCLTAVTTVLTATPALASDDVDVVLSAHSVPAGARTGGLINAGAAVLEGLTGLLVNPAIPNRYYSAKENKVGFAYSYGRGGVFSDHIMTAGAAYSFSPELTVAGMYRLLRQDEKRHQNDFVLNASGRMFDKSIDRGAVDIGINLRLEDMRWERRGLRSTRTTHGWNDLDSAWQVDTVTHGDLERTMDWEERRLLLDVGLYQRQFTDKLDFGVTFHNVLGYRWRRGYPEIRGTRDYQFGTDSTDTTAIIDSSFYIETPAGRDWIEPYYKRLSIGMLYHTYVVDGKALVQIPLQLELIGFMDRGADTHLTFRTGLEVWLRDSYCLRFGYARAPRTFPANASTTEYENDNIFGGGGGILLDRFGINLYVYGEEWGLGGTVAF